MVTLIIGTHRPQSNSSIVAGYYSRLLEERGIPFEIVDLHDLPKDFVYSDMFGKRSESVQQLIDQKIEPAEKYVFFIPEYNGGVPGVLKAFVDCLSPRLFSGKKAGLVGISSGKAGSLRGMDQFTNVLNYLKVSVLYAKPKLSEIDDMLDESMNITNKRVIELLSKHVDLLLKF